MSSVELARAHAVELDKYIHEAVGTIVFNSPNSLFINLRRYLQIQDDRLAGNNDLFRILRFTDDASGMALMSLGPQIDKGDSPSHFHFPSGSRLSFGITVKRGNQCSLVSYRFHYHYGEGCSPAFLRFDLNHSPHNDPLSEPRCHLHPGLDNVRLAIPALTPFQVLDRIFFVLE